MTPEDEALVMEALGTLVETQARMLELLAQLVGVTERQMLVGLDMMER